MEYLQELLVLLGSLGGLAAVIAGVINLLKIPGWLPDGWAPTLSAGLNLLALAVLFAVGVWFPDLDVLGLDEKLAEFAAVAVPFFTYALQLLMTKLGHTALRGIPGIGKSYSL